MNIQTERTELRYFLDSDSTDLYDYLSKAEIYQFEPGTPVSRDEAENIALDRAKGKNFIAVVERKTNKLIGHFSFFQAEPYFTNTFELGFIFNPIFQGKGYATEAGQAFIQYCFTEAHVHRIISNCNPENTKSWKLLERLGLKREGLLIKNIFFTKENNKPVWLNTFVYGIVNNNE